MALDHSRLGLKNKFLKNKSGQVRCLTGLLYKILPTNLGLCKSTFYTFYTAHLRWSSTIYHTDLTQNTVFHNFSRQIFRTINRGLLAKPFKTFPKLPIRLTGSHFWQAPNFQSELWWRVLININRVMLQQNKEFIMFIFLFNGFITMCNLKKCLIRAAFWVLVQAKCMND